MSFIVLIWVGGDPNLANGVKQRFFTYIGKRTEICSRVLYKLCTTLFNGKMKKWFDTSNVCLLSLEYNKTYSLVAVRQNAFWERLHDRNSPELSMHKELLIDRLR